MTGRQLDYRLGPGPGSGYTIAGFLGGSSPPAAEDFSFGQPGRYDGAVFGLGTLGRRALEGTVSLFAVLGFLYVPLGQHTGFEHARAVLGTPAARAAVQDLTGAALALRTRVLELATARVSPPVAEGPAAPAKEPRPIPPKLK